MSGLTTAQIRFLLPKLPLPILQCKIKDAVFKVYKVKGWLDSRLYDQHLYKLLLTARESFGVYGRPLLDKYDPKSAIYLVRVQYPLSSYPVEEWLSMRLVPGEEKPFGTGELDLFICKRRPSKYLAQKRLFGNGKGLLNHIASTSRMGGIDPYFRREKSERLLSMKLSKRHRYTVFCYALINLVFLEEYPEHLSYRYVTGIIHNRYVEKALTTIIDGKKYSPAFTPAYQILGFKKPSEIKLNRRINSCCVYQFPTYFLNVRQLVKVLLRLIDEGKLSKSTMRCYLGVNLAPQDLSLETWPLIKKLKNLGKLLTVEGRIKASSIMGEELREILDKEVEDGPELKITRVDVIEASVNRLLTAAKMKRY